MSHKEGPTAVFELSSNGVLELAKVLCACLNVQEMKSLIIVKSNFVNEQSQAMRSTRNARESMRRLIDMILTDGISPPADPRHFIEQIRPNEPLERIYLSVQNENLSAFPHLLRRSLFDGQIYTITKNFKASKEHDGTLSNDKDFITCELDVGSIDFCAADQWSHRLEAFALPLMKSLLSENKAFLSTQGLHQNISTLSLCVVAIFEENLCAAEKSLMKDSETSANLVYRWYMAIQSASNALITVGYIRTIFSSPLDAALPKNLARSLLSGNFDIDQASLQNIAAHRYEQIQTLSANERYVFAVHCGYVERFENGYRGDRKRRFKETRTCEHVFRFLEPQLSFTHSPSGKPTSIDKLQHLWDEVQSRQALADKNLRQFRKKLQSPLYTEFSLKAKKANEAHDAIRKKKSLLGDARMEETMFLELKDISSLSESAELGCVSKFVTQNAIKYTTAFLNAHGGCLLFGANDSGHLSGTSANIEELKRSCFAGYKGIRPVAPQHMAFIKALPLGGEKDQAKHALEFGVSHGQAPFYTAGAPLCGPSWARFLSSTIPLHSSVILERLAIFAHQQSSKAK